MYPGKIKQRVMLSTLTVLLMLSCCLLGCGSSSPALNVAPEIGALAPDFTLPTLDKQVVSLNELRGQPLVLNFWATWCGPCRMEMPYIEAAFNQKGDGVRFIAINLGDKEGKARQFVQYMGMSFTVALDLDLAVGNAYNVRYIPTTFFIDKEGVIRHIKVGPFSSEDELMALLEGL